ncbi:testicular acid phosphatase homolog isoform X1 [Folsomia candida]|uniref:testicular acid phosphatase homolog isoform X1 n=1 Tax=Folsomia candida TaxID=158441 RepID=UPI000B9030A3|nr:testicular acid phosphatase homolog isoform X1 [Folsomia candida]
MHSCRFLKYMFVLYFSLSLLLYNAEGTCSVLKAATVIFRHGERNPIRSYPGDPYSSEELYWPEGYGIMTENGKRQVYKLGQYLRQRYLDLPTKDNILILSSQRNRTLTSASLMLNGYFEDSDNTEMNFEGTEHVDKITVIPIDKDDFIFVSQHCPKYFLLRDKYRKMERKDPFGGWKNEVEIITQNTGLKFDSVDLKIFFLTDTILVQKSRNLVLPAWAEQLYENGAIQGMKTFFYTSAIPTDDLTRLYTGSMVTRFFDSMDKVMDDELGLGVINPRVTVLSGHDTTIALWLTNLGLGSNLDIPYGSALFLEVCQIMGSTGEQKFEIEVSYKNDTNAEPTLLHIPGCPTPCSYSDFKKLLAPRSIRNREEHCTIIADEEDTVSSSNHTSSGSVNDKVVANNYFCSLFITLLSLFF